MFSCGSDIYLWGSKQNCTELRSVLCAVCAADTGAVCVCVFTQPAILPLLARTPSSWGSPHSSLRLLTPSVFNLSGCSLSPCCAPKQQPCPAATCSLWWLGKCPRGFTWQASANLPSIGHILSNEAVITADRATSLPLLPAIISSTCPQQYAKIFLSQRGL